MDPKPGKLAQAKHIFADAVDTPAQQRPGLLDRACAGDAELRAIVTALLDAHAAAAKFMDAPSTAPEAAAASPSAQTEQSGALIGPYRLLEQIGEGGFGVVFMAEQTEPVVRRVALKVIKLGMDTRQVIARFEAERQALAMMDHPNIAKVLDAGATETGRPYFVMELVRGDPITEYCDKHNLTTGERLGLFAEVCHAVQHAHQKGVIHRDIKPSNVLVTMFDGRPIPKVIDFGIAKAINQRLTEKTLFTAHRQLIGTPQYMSPEQAEMSGVDIDTRSDIYSLGVLLYELLTGTTPFDPEHLRSAALAEVARIIREEEPPKPSTRLNEGAKASKAQAAKAATTGAPAPTAPQAPDTASIAAHRRTDAAHLVRSVRGDLDWIVMKCLEKDRARRYETANGLAADIQRHLNDEPVMAGAPTAGYKLRKFVKRNRAHVIAGSIVAGTLVLGLVGTTGGMIWALSEKDRADAEKTRAAVAAESEARAKVQAQENEKKANSETKRAETIIEFVTTALRAGDAAMSGHEGGTVGAGQDMTILAAMDNAIKDIDSGRFKDDPETEARLRDTIATILKNNGRLAEGELLYRDALEAFRRVLGDEHPDTLKAMNNLGNLLHARGKLAEAEPYLSDALDTSRRVLGNDHPNTLTSINNMGALLWGQGLQAQGPYAQDKLAEAEPYFREALDKRRRLLGDDHPDTLISINNMGALLKAQGKLAEAEPYFREALQSCRRVLGDEHPDTLSSVNSMGSLLEAQGNRAEAEPYFFEALEMSRRLFKGDHPEVAYSLSNVASVLQAQGRVAEAEPLLAQGLEMYRRLYQGDHPEVAKGLDNLAKARQDLGREAEAEPLLAQALEMRRRLYQGDHPDLATGLNNLANVRLALGHAADAEQLHVESLEMRRRLYQGDHPAVATALNNLARTHQALGKTAEARQGFDQAVAMLLRSSPDGSPMRARVLWCSGSARFENGDGGDAAAALPELEEAVAMAEKLLPPEHPHLMGYRETLAKCRTALAEQEKPDAKGGGG
jgi:serine/threonine protein kinase/tetratricopeptide (TPR) repeat protein